MKTLLPLAEAIALRLIARHETIAVAESSTGGLIAAALLSVPGASAYFLGGAVVYTKAARAALLGIGDADMAGLAAVDRGLCAAVGAAHARAARRRLGHRRNRRDGPTGNRYGDPAGHTCIAIAGPAERAVTLRTGSADRVANMDAFAKRAFELLVDVFPGRVARLAARRMTAARQATRSRAAPMPKPTARAGAARRKSCWRN